ncbi:MAG: hypothetical protein WD749_07145 [Phycisphaerales bacterium]
MAFGWFHGENNLGQPLADVRSGACCDGLQLSGVNRNQGAESTLAYLWTELHFRQSQGVNSSPTPPPERRTLHIKAEETAHAG